MLTWSQRASLTIEVWRTVARGQEVELESEGRANHRGLEDCSERTGHGKVAERGSQPFGWRNKGARKKLAASPNSLSFQVLTPIFDS